MKYELVIGRSASELSAQVNKYLKMGYEVYGPTLAVTDFAKAIDLHYAQAVIERNPRDTSNAPSC